MSVHFESFEGFWQFPDFLFSEEIQNNIVQIYEELTIMFRSMKN